MRAFVRYVLYLASGLPRWLLVSMKVEKEIRTQRQELENKNS